MVLRVPCGVEGRAAVAMKVATVVAISMGDSVGPSADDPSKSKDAGEVGATPASGTSYIGVHMKTSIELGICWRLQCRRKADERGC